LRLADLAMLTPTEKPCEDDSIVFMFSSPALRIDLTIGARRTLFLVLYRCP
jgi:hypothetical protein